MKFTSIILTLGLWCGATATIGQETLQTMPQQEQGTEVTDQELEKFATVYLEVQTESEKMQGEAVEVIEKEGMGVERFNELANAQNDPSQEVEAEEEELEKITVIGTKIQKIQTDFQERVAGMIEKQGLTIQRYQEVYQAIQQDQNLQQRFGELING